MTQGSIPSLSEWAGGATPCLTAADLGDEIDEATVGYWGCCPECLAESPVLAGG